MGIEHRIALIGMPGCGKTTIGKILKEKTNIDLIDLDEYIVEMEGKSIDDIFIGGEDEFRKCETKALIETALLNGPFIVSTGGGIVKKSENINILREKFLVVFIDRPADNIYQDIDTDSRPLLKNNKNALIDLYNERYGLYKSACHISINNDNNIEKVVDNIINEIMSYKGFNSH